MNFVRKKGQHTSAVKKKTLYVSHQDLSQLTAFTVSHEKRRLGWHYFTRAVQTLFPVMQVHSKGHSLPRSGEFKSSLGTVLFFSRSPTPVWYFGDSLFTEAGEDDNGLYLILC